MTQARIVGSTPAELLAVSRTRRPVVTVDDLVAWGTALMVIALLTFSVLTHL